MSYFSKTKSYDHRIQALGGGGYTISWTVDTKYEGSRLRYPTGHQRHTDRAGAERFAKKWGLKMPVEKAPPAAAAQA